MRCSAGRRNQLLRPAKGLTVDIFAMNQPFDFGGANYNKGGRYGPVNQSHMDIAYLLRGTAIVHADGTTFTAHAGMVSFIYTEQILEVIYPADEAQEVLWCHTGEVVAPMEYRAQLRAVPRSLAPSPLIIKLLKEGANLAGESSNSTKRVRDALGATVFNEYFRLAHLDQEDSRLPKAVLLAKMYLEEHFSEDRDLHLKDISDFASLSPNYLLELFKKHVGKTPKQYLWSLRTRKGAHLLLKTGLPISTISYECGFKCPHHFSRVIRSTYGSSPSELREQEWMRNPADFNRDIPDLVFA